MLEAKADGDYSTSVKRFETNDVIIAISLHGWSGTLDVIENMYC